MFLLKMLNPAENDTINNLPVSLITLILSYSLLFFGLTLTTEVIEEKIKMNSALRIYFKVTELNTWFLRA